jgi:hypothetical protein
MNYFNCLNVLKNIDLSNTNKINDKNVFIMFFLSIIFVANFIGIVPASAGINPLSDTNYVSAKNADSIMAAIEAKLDKSGYGFYNIVCKDSFTLYYRLFIPTKVPGTKYPLVFTFPGSGAQGTDNTKQMGGVGASIWGQPQYQALHPHYSAVPQTSASIPAADYKTFTVNEYKELRDTLVKLYSDIDSTRIYVTGHSAGGSFVYRILGMFPGSFAAGIAADGAMAGDKEGYDSMAVWPNIYVTNNTGLWMFNGGDSDVVKPNQINGMFNIADSIMVHNGSPITSFMPNLNHAEVEGLYKLEPGLFDWLFAQHLEVTGIADDKTNQSINIYPNPASDFIEITNYKLPITNIEIINALGQLVLNLTTTFCAPEGVKIDISALPVGIYIIKAGINVQKFVKI